MSSSPRTVLSTVSGSVDTQESESISHSVVFDFVTPWTVAHQAPLSMWFSSKKTGVGCHFLLQGIFTQDWVANCFRFLVSGKQQEPVVPPSRVKGLRLVEMVAFFVTFL